MAKNSNQVKKDTNIKNAEEVKNTEEVKNAEAKKNTTNKEKIYIVGEVAGVHFAYGKAEVKNGWILNWFKEKGYKISEKK